MRAITPSLVATALALVLHAPAVAAQRVVSLGVSSTLPGVNPDIRQATGTLEIGAPRFPLRLRADFSAVLPRTMGVQAVAGASLLLPFLNRPFTPYLLGGAFKGMNGTFGGQRQITGGIRVGGGLRYRVDDRVLFLESARCYCDYVGGTLLTFGVQF